MKEQGGVTKDRANLLKGFKNEDLRCLSHEGRFFESIVRTPIEGGIPCIQNHRYILILRIIFLQSAILVERPKI